MADQSLGDVISRLSTPANALAALGLALDARVRGVPLPPGIAPHLDEVLTALGLREALDSHAPAELAPLLAGVRVFGLANARLLSLLSQGPGWTPADPELLLAAGEFSVEVPHRLKSVIAPRLPGLAERLEAPGAAFLDIGVGVAALAVEMARVWPRLRVVGVEPLAEALALGRERIEAAGLEDRVELRHGRGEDLADTDCFDLAWVPSMFIPEPVLPALLQRVHAALRPGGWTLFPTIRPSTDPLNTALMRLRVASFGGLVGTPELAEDILRSAGFVSVATMPAAPIATGATVVGQRPG